MDQPDVRRTLAAASIDEEAERDEQLSFYEKRVEHAARQDAIRYALAVLRGFMETPTRWPSIASAIAELEQMQEDA